MSMKSSEVQTNNSRYLMIIVLLVLILSIVSLQAIVSIPVMMEQANLQHQVRMLQRQINSSCARTADVFPYPTPKQEVIEKSLPNTAHFSFKEVSPFDYKVAPFIMIMDEATVNEKLNNKEAWKSEPFFAFSEGYLMYISVYVADSDDGEGNYMSIYLHLMKGPYDDDLQWLGLWPLRGTFKIELFNDSPNRKIQIFYLIPNYLLCEFCTFRVVEGSEALAGWGYPYYAKYNTSIYKLLPGSLYFHISYSNHLDDNKYLKEILLERFTSMIYIVFESSKHIFLLYIVIPLVMDLVYKYDIIFYIQTLQPLHQSVPNDTIKTIIVMELLFAADILLVIVSDYMNIGDNISAAMHCLVMRMVMVSLFAYMASMIHVIIRLLLFFEFISKN